MDNHSIINNLIGIAGQCFDPFEKNMPLLYQWRIGFRTMDGYIIVPTKREVGDVHIDAPGAGGRMVYRKRIPYVHQKITGNRKNKSNNDKQFGFSSFLQIKVYAGKKFLLTDWETIHNKKNLILA